MQVINFSNFAASTIFVKTTRNWVLYFSNADSPSRCENDTLVDEPTMDLQSYLEINATETLNFTRYVCGSPQPNVTVNFGDEALKVATTRLSNHWYKFEAKREQISTEDCGKKFSYTASNEYGEVNQETELSVSCKF